MKLMSDNISNIAKALVSAQKEMGNALKDSKNPFFKSSYADLNAVREAVLPACNANGISVLQPTIFYEGKKFVQTMLMHESGEFISGLTEILAVKETDAQAQGSGISYARRYGLQSLANVGAEDDDGNGASGKKAEPIRQSSVGAGGLIGGIASGISSGSTTLPPSSQELSSTQPIGGQQNAARASETPNKKSFRKQTPTNNEEL